MLAMVLATMTGTLFLYQGQEIGMTNAPRSWPAEEYKCIKSVNYWSDVQKKSEGDSGVLEKALDGIQLMARDHARVPMQWDSSPNAGFCGRDAKPWMRVVDNYTEINVAEQTGRQDSVLEFWKRMLKARKEHKDLFVYGKFQLIEQGDDLLVFSKEDNGKKSLTVANLVGERRKWKMPEKLAALNFQPLVANIGSGCDSLEPYEGRVYVCA